MSAPDVPTGSAELPLDPRSALDLVNDTHQQTQRSLLVRTDLLYAVWGLVWLVGLGAMCLTVWGQSPYRGPAAWSGILLAVLIVLALLTTMAVTGRATRGIGGDAATQGRYYGLSWFVGFAAWFAILGGVARHGASDEVMGLLGAAGPMLVVSLIYMNGAAIWRDRTMFVLGVWMAALAAVGVMLGPVLLLLVEAVGGGAAFFVAALWVARRPVAV